MKRLLLVLHLVALTSPFARHVAPNPPRSTQSASHVIPASAAYARTPRARPLSPLVTRHVGVDTTGPHACLPWQLVQILKKKYGKAPEYTKKNRPQPKKEGAAGGPEKKVRHVEKRIVVYITRADPLHTVTSSLSYGA